MQMQWKEEGDRSFLVIRDEGYADSFSMKMVLENKIAGFSPVHIRSFNGESFFYYEYSGKLSLSEIVKQRKLTKEQLVLLYQSLMIVYNVAADFFLNQDGICLMTDLIFLDEKEAVFCYYPQTQTGFLDAFSHFSELLLAFVDTNEEEGVVFAYQIYMASKKGLSFVDRLLKEKLPKTEQIAKTQAEGADTYAEYREESEEIDEFQKEDACLTSRNGDEKKKNKTERRPFVFFALLCIISIGYACFLYSERKVTSVVQFLLLKEGMVTIGFFFLGILGMITNSKLQEMLPFHFGERIDSNL